MILPEYMFLSHPELEDKTLILQTVPPFLVAHVWRFTSAAIADKTLKTAGIKPLAKIPGYYIYVQAFATLQQASVPLSLTDFKAITPTHDQQNTIDQMADFYLQKRILQHAPKFKRYKEAN